MRTASAARRAVRAVVSAAVGLLVLSGCVRLDGDLTINGTDSDTPDTVSGTMLIAVSDDWAISQGEDPARLAQVLVEELAATSESGLSGEPYAADGYSGATLTLDAVPIERLRAATDGALAITREGDEYVLRGDLSVLDGYSDADGVTWTARVSLTMPEDVTEHNGTLEGRTVTWDLDAAGDDRTLLATSSVGQVSWLSRVPVWLLVITGVAAIGAGATWWWSRKRKAADGGAPVARTEPGERSSRKVEEIFDEPVEDE